MKKISEKFCLIFEAILYITGPKIWEGRDVWAEGPVHLVESVPSTI